MPTKFDFFFLSSLLAFLSLTGLAVAAWSISADYGQVSRALVEAQQATGRLDAAGARLLEALSFGAYEGHSQALIQLRELLEEQQRLASKAQWMLAAFWGLAGLWLLLAAWLRPARRALAGVMVWIALPALLVGISAPVLTIEASQTLPLLGKVMLHYESKSIMGTIEALHAGGNFILALVMLAFSILLPAAKTMLLLLRGGSRFDVRAARGLRLMRQVGKWSMADVFVVAILVAFFATEQGESTQAEVGIGLYFFAGYVLLSLVASQLLDQGDRRGGD